MRRFIEPVLLSVGGLTIAWLILEVVLRMGATTFPYTIVAPMRDVAKHPFTADKILPEQIWFDDDSYQLITPPGIDNEFHYPDPRIGLHISTANWLDPNSKVGFRVPSTGWEPNWPVDVVAVGDSFTFCYVDYVHCWVERLAAEHGFSMVNLGLVATGSTSHKNVLNTFGLPHKPKVVIWQWYGNDFNDDYGFKTQYGDDAVERKGGEFAPPSWFRQHSAVVSIIYSISQASQGSTQYAQFIDPYTASISTGAGEETIYFGRSYMQEAYTLKSEKNQEGAELTKQAILDSKSRLDEAGIQLILVLIPSKEEVYHTWTAEQLPADMLDELSAGRLQMLNFCQKESLNCVDTTQSLTNQANIGNLVYHTQDTHLNAAGNQLLADLLAQELKAFIKK